MGRADPVDPACSNASGGRAARDDRNPVAAGIVWAGPVRAVAYVLPSWRATSPTRWSPTSRPTRSTSSATTSRTIALRSVTIAYRGSGLNVDVVPVIYEGEAEDVGYLTTKMSCQVGPPIPSTQRACGEPLLLCMEAVAKSRLRPRRLRPFRDGAELRHVRSRSGAVVAAERARLAARRAPGVVRHRRRRRA